MIRNDTACEAALVCFHHFPALFMNRPISDGTDMPDSPAPDCLNIRSPKFSKMFAKLMLLTVLIFSGISTGVQAQDDAARHFSVTAPTLVLNDIDFTITIEPQVTAPTAADTLPLSYRIQTADGTVLAEGLRQPEQIGEPIEISGLSFSNSGSHPLTVSYGSVSETVSTRSIPGILSLLPALLAIAMALITRQVIVALFFGIWLGASIVAGYNPLMGFLRTFDHYIVEALSDSDRIYILIFSLALGGMVGVISKSGGTQGIVEWLSQYASNRRRGQLATWAMGVLIFFDDYANTLIVGNTMRPLADKLRISREKLSYLVDSTAAPIANVAIISTWIGYEISLINDAFVALEIGGNPYITFLKTIPYNFYPIFTLFFGLFITLLTRDYGPMWHAEYRAHSTGRVLRADATPLANMSNEDILADENTPKRWYNALIPVGTVIATVCIGLIATGWSDGWSAIAAAAAAENVSPDDISLMRKVSAIIGASNSFSSLMWAAFIGGIVAIVMALGQRLLSLQQSMSSWVGGIQAMMMAAIILTAAWSIGDICKALLTADYVVHLTRPFLQPQWLPLLIFLSAAVMAFATGTSWGTMAILMPISIPLAHQAPAMDPTIDAAHGMAILLSTTAAVLAGATFGDHCSPISDTTIMSSMASSADHIDHVRTQLPYALTVGGVSCMLGYIPVGFGMNEWLLMPLGIGICFLVIRFVGKKVE